ncbi:putative monocarboxylate transporter 13-like [Daphnia sinensis]|uniref:Monocarboxylate transporter 13-like n=1 Tax=Daphnia sinensis TaxID=1820382 RepID=A0AAD5PQG7_9CRUS|nr:putative monocarboxylate transporter 13-like [Daphnia sinensis]
MANKSVELKEMKNGEIVEDDADDGPPHIVPPDGGWGWVVMIASFFCNIIVDGIIFSFGLVVTNLAESFEVPVSTVSWVASLLAGFYLLAGPFVSSLATRFGFRLVACAGSIVAGLSFAVASLAMSVEFLYVFIGVVGGIGMGLVYVPAVVAVGFYFEKRRALATGIAVCGSGIGTFVLAPFTTWLLGYYGWRGTLLIHGGLVLNCAVFGAMFRPLEPAKKKSVRRQLADEEVSAGTPLMVRIKKERDEKMRNEERQETAQTDHFHSSTNSLNNTVKLVGIKNKRSSTLTDSSASLGKKETPLLAGSKRSLANQDDVQPLNRDDAFYTGSLQRLPQYRENPASYHASVTRIPDAVEEADGGKKSSRCMRAVSSLIQFSLFKSATFDLLCFSSFITFLGFFVPFMFLAARAEQLGADKESASFLLSIIGVTNTVGRVVCGALSDHPKVNVLFVNNAALTLGGVVTIATPFFPAYEMLIVYACLFGLSIACFASLRSILMVELLGLENLTNAFGLCLMFTGVSATVGGPLASMFFDATNDYDASFYLSGSMILISGILCYPLGYINRWEKRRNNAAQHNKQKVKPLPEPEPLAVA